MQTCPVNVTDSYHIVPMAKMIIIHKMQMELPRTRHFERFAALVEKKNILGEDIRRKWTNAHECFEFDSMVHDEFQLHAEMDYVWVA